MPINEKKWQNTYAREAFVSTGIIALQPTATDEVIVDCIGLTGVKTFWIYPISADVTFSLWGTADPLMTEEEFIAHPVNELEEIEAEQTTATKFKKEVVSRYRWLKIRAHGTGTGKLDFAGY
jgi:hypothetical protein